MVVEKGYKLTEVGVIPEDWETKELTSILTFGNGQGYKHLSDGDIPVYGTGGVMTYVNNFLYDGISVGIGRKGTIDKPILFNGKFWTVDTLFYTHNFRGSDPVFIYYKFGLIKWREYNEASGVPSLNKSTLGKIRVSLPPLHEQTAIATALSDMDALIAQTEKLIEKKKAIKQGVMQELLKPKDGWVTRKLGEVCEIYTGRRNNQDKKGDGEYPFFVRSQIVEKIDTYSFDGEAILVPGEGNIGKIFHYINGKFDFHQRVYKISGFSKDVHPKYVFLFLKENFGRYALANTVKATVDSLRLPTFLEFELPFPSSIEEQSGIAELLFDMDGQLNCLISKLQKLKLQKQGMMQALLTGKIRLV